MVKNPPFLCRLGLIPGWGLRSHKPKKNLSSEISFCLFKPLHSSASQLPCRPVGSPHTVPWLQASVFNVYGRMPLREGGSTEQRLKVLPLSKLESQPLPLNHLLCSLASELQGPACQRGDECLLPDVSGSLSWDHVCEVFARCTLHQVRLSPRSRAPVFSAGRDTGLS